MSARRTRFALPQRILHWVMAVCVLAMLFIGVGMVSTTTTAWPSLFHVHKPLGIAILVLVLVRLALRVKYGAPALPADLPPMVKLAAISSQYVFYALMLAMPLLGWGMLSAASHPVTLFGTVHLPAILPVDANLYSLLRRAHDALAFAFFALILGHVTAALGHKLIRNDGVFEAMAPVVTKEQAELVSSSED